MLQSRFSEGCCCCSQQERRNEYAAPRAWFVDVAELVGRM